jgi:alpha-L-fucosidase
MELIRLTLLILLMGPALFAQTVSPVEDRPATPVGIKNIENGAQRLTKTQIQQWESLGYGMFIHFGMSTYDGIEMSPGALPATAFNPTKLNVEQWIRTAAEAGMKYAVLTTKHVSGFCQNNPRLEMF